MVTFFLVITSQSAIEIILNFTAVNFISGMDESAFLNVKFGKYGRYFEKKVKRIQQRPLPACLQSTKHHSVYHWQSIMFIFVCLFSFYGFIIYNQESRNHWVTKQFAISLNANNGAGDDDSGGFHGGFDGCYEIDGDSSASLDDFKRYKYRMQYNDGVNDTELSIQYCTNNRRWILFTQNETITDACTANSSSVDVLAKSSKTTSFDISSSFDETWFSSTNTPLEIFFIDDNDNNNIFPNAYCFPIGASGSIPTEYGLLTNLTDLSLLGKPLKLSKSRMMSFVTPLFMCLVLFLNYRHFCFHYIRRENTYRYHP